MVTTYPTISLCMIAKNEEAWIGQCIRSVLPIVSEVILVDTGSTDRTVAIAEELGAKVFHRPWDDDFSAPRNLSIEKASGEWILVLDADEAIDERDHETIRNHTLNRSCCYEFMQRHYSNDARISAFRPATGEYPAWERTFGGFFESNLCRLFPHHEGIQYIGRVHELVEHSIRKIARHNIERSPVPIHHYGHSDAVKKTKKKGELYTPLGTAKLGDDPTYWQAWFELGVEHNNNGRLKESVEAFTKALELNPRYVQSWLNIGYVLCELGQYEDARKTLTTAIGLDKQCFEAYCNLGVVHLRTGQHSNAEKCFRVAVRLSPTYVNAWCNLGKSLAFQRRTSEAAYIYKRALELLPNSATAKNDLAILYLGAGHPAEAKRFLTDLVAENPTEPKTHYLIAQAAKALGDTALAVAELSSFCELSEKLVLSNEHAQMLQGAKEEIQRLSLR